MIGVLAMMLATAPALAVPAIQVNIEGISGELLGNVRASLSVVRYRDSAELNPGIVRRLYERAPHEIRLALEPFGYFSPTIADRLEPTSTGWVVRFTIDPGPRVHVRRVDVRVIGAGKDDAVFTSYLANLPVHPGDALRQTQYQVIKQRLQEIAAARGYLDAHFTGSTLRIDPKELWADEIIDYDTGPRYRFGTVQFNQDILAPSFIRQFVPFKTGDPFDSDQVLQLQYALADSEYFATVDVEVKRRETKNLRIPIVVHTTPRKRNKYKVGVGYGTDTGPRATLAWTNRRLNRQGHRLSAELQYSRVKSSESATYVIPQADPAREQLAYAIQNDQEQLGTGVSRSTQFSITRTSLQGAWQRNTYLQLHWDRTDIGTQTSFARLILPGVSWSRTVTDDPIYPTHGYRALLDVRGTDQALGSDTGFLQVHLQAKLVESVWSGGRLLLRGEAGASAVDRFSELPLSQRFFTGGDTTVRGFGYNQLGPRDAQGNIVGGRHLLVGSVELDQLVVGNWGFAVFSDVGNAMDSLPAPLEKSVGLGLRWRTPVGMVRVDLAHPIARPDLDYVRLHVSIGPDL